MNRYYGLMLLLNLILCVSVAAQTRKPPVQAIPAWVTVTTIDYSNTQLDQEADDGYVNLDYEEQVSLPQQSIYYKRVIRILNESGVQNSSEVNVGYDPSYSQLIFHTLKVIREGKTINKLEPSKFRIIQQENELGMNLYNGSLSAILILEDIRKGDIIEYCYTVKGFNPVFKGRFAGLFETQFSVPIYNMYYKLLAPESKPFQIKNCLTNVACTRTKVGDQIAYEWKLNNIEPVSTQDYTPSWYDPYSMVLFSEYQGWKEVNDWARELFPQTVKLSPALSSKIGELAAKHTTPQARVLAALRFVQDDVRYMGIEMGPRSHKPHDPNKILAQRFGDCKDKSYLLCTMLWNMGIEAQPVLINTDLKKSLFELLPSPRAFNHVTVRVRLNNKYYWFDPTIAYQRGPIDAIAYPDYQCGLVISDTTTSLTRIPVQDKGMVKVQEIFDIPDMFSKVRFKVHTVATGSFADDARDAFNSASKSTIKEDYKDFYAHYYEKITADSISYKDDEATGSFITDEYYTIEDFWGNEEGVQKCYFSPYVIDGVLKTPKDKSRKMPISLVYPAKYEEEIIVNVPEDWNMAESMHTINRPYLKLQAQFAYFYRQVRLKYEYESLRDHVTEKESGKYLADLKEMDEELSYTLSNGKEKVLGDANDWTNRSDLPYLVMGGVALGGLVIWLLQKRRR